MDNLTINQALVDAQVILSKLRYQVANTNTAAWNYLFRVSKHIAAEQENLIKNL